MLLLSILRSTVVPLCSNLSYRYDSTNVVDAGKRHRLQGGKLSGNNLLASLMYEDNRGTAQFGLCSQIGPLVLYIFGMYTVLPMINIKACPPTVFERTKFLPTWIFLVILLHMNFRRRATIVLRY